MKGSYYGRSTKRKRKRESDILRMGAGKAHFPLAFDATSNFAQDPSCVLLKWLQVLQSHSKQLDQAGTFFFLISFDLFIFGCIGSSLLCVGFLQLRGAGVTLCCSAQASHCSGFSCCAEHGLHQLWLAGFRAQAQQLWHRGLVAPQHVGSSWTRARTCVPCIGRQILNRCATGEVLRNYSNTGIMYLRNQNGHSKPFFFFFFFFWPRRWPCGILVPQRRIEPRPLSVKVRSLNHWTTGEFPQSHFLSPFVITTQVPGG